MNRIRMFGSHLAFIWDRNDQSNVYVMPVAGGWPAQLTTDRGGTPY